MLFTIITISYNSEKTIERTIKSVLAQTYVDYEYIIVDGGSTDDTLSIVKKYEPQFEGRMKWKSEPDKGIYNAMNKGIKMSCGDIIGIVNSDDWLEIDAIEIVSAELIKQDNPFDVIYTGEVLFHYDDGNTQRYVASKKRLESKAKKYCMGINHPATFVPAKIYDKFGIYDERFKLYADSDFVLRCFEKGVKFVFINKVLSNMADGGASNTRTHQMLDDTILRFRLHSKSSLEYYYLTIKSRIMWYVSPLIPQRFIRIYRRIAQKL